MAKGKYQSKGQPAWLAAAVLLVVLVIIVVLIVVMVNPGGSNDVSDPKVNSQTDNHLEPTDPTEPEPTEPEPTEPEPTEPEPTEPEPTEPEPTEPEPTEPEPTEPEPTETNPTEPEPTDPPEPTQPEPTQPIEPKPTLPATSKGEEVANLAISLEGKPEKQPGMSGDDPSGFDTTGFVRYCFRASGVDIPESFYDYGSKIEKISELMPGDIVFFEMPEENGGTYTYVGVYTGNGEFAAVSSGRKMVIVRPVSWFASEFTFGRRCC